MKSRLMTYRQAIERQAERLKAQEVRLTILIEENASLQSAALDKARRAEEERGQQRTHFDRLQAQFISVSARVADLLADNGRQGDALRVADVRWEEADAELRSSRTATLAQETAKAAVARELLEVQSLVGELHGSLAAERLKASASEADLRSAWVRESELAVQAEVMAAAGAQASHRAMKAGEEARVLREQLSEAQRGAAEAAAAMASARAQAGEAAERERQLREERSAWMARAEAQTLRAASPSSTPVRTPVRALPGGDGGEDLVEERGLLVPDSLFKPRQATPAAAAEASDAGMQAIVTLQEQLQDVNDALQEKVAECIAWKEAYDRAAASLVAGRAQEAALADAAARIEESEAQVDNAVHELEAMAEAVAESEAANAAAGGARDHAIAERAVFEERAQAMERSMREGAVELEKARQAVQELRAADARAADARVEAARTELQGQARAAEAQVAVLQEALHASTLAAREPIAWFPGMSTSLSGGGFGRYSYSLPSAAPPALPASAAGAIGTAVRSRLTGQLEDLRRQVHATSLPSVAPAASSLALRGSMGAFRESLAVLPGATLSRDELDVPARHLPVMQPSSPVRGSGDAFGRDSPTSKILLSLRRELAESKARLAVASGLAGGSAVLL